MRDKDSREARERDRRGRERDDDKRERDRDRDRERDNKDSDRERERARDKDRSSRRDGMLDQGSARKEPGATGGVVGSRSSRRDSKNEDADRDRRGGDDSSHKRRRGEEDVSPISLLLSTRQFMTILNLLRNPRSQSASVGPMALVTLLQAIKTANGTVRMDGNVTVTIAADGSGMLVIPGTITNAIVAVTDVVRAKNVKRVVQRRRKN